MSLAERLLLDRLRERDEDAFAEIVNVHGNRVFNLVLRMVGDPHRAGAACDDRAALVDRQHRAGRPLPVGARGSEELERLAVERRRRPRPRVHTAHEVAHGLRVARPVDDAGRLLEHRRVRRPSIVLGRGHGGARGDGVQRLEQRRSADLRQPRGQRPGGVVLAHGLAPHQQHRAGVHPLVELHDRHAGLGLAVDDRPLHRRGAAVGRQHRPVHVDAAPGERVEHRARQDLPVRDHHGDVGAGGPQRLGHLRRARRARLVGRQPGLHGEPLHRRRGQLLAAPGRLVRLRHDQDHLVTRHHRAQRRQRELRRPHEHHPHS